VSFCLKSLFYGRWNEKNPVNRFETFGEKGDTDVLDTYGN
jgi:hypothetical protein